MSCKSFSTMTLFFLLLLPGSLGRQDIALIMPEAVERGKPVTIKCLYNLGKENLYQVSWYRAIQEFCRYTPEEVPPLQIFPIPGLDVYPKGSDAKQINISAATSAAQGHYTCEVVADSPLLPILRSHGFMYVVDLPKTYPDLIWKQSRLYRPGMKIKVDCICYDSMPPANLSFYINDKPALPEHVWYRVSGRMNGSLWTAYSTLEFVVRKHHIKEFRIRIRCEATIYSVFYKSHEKSAQAKIIRTTIAPYTWTRGTSACPKHYISQNSASWNPKNLWTICSVALIVYGEKTVKGLIY